MRMTDVETLSFTLIIVIIKKFHLWTCFDYLLLGRIAVARWLVGPKKQRICELQGGPKMRGPQTHDHTYVKSLPIKKFTGRLLGTFLQLNGY